MEEEEEGLYSSLQYYSSGATTTCDYYCHSIPSTVNPAGILMDVPPPPTMEGPVNYGAKKEQLVSGSSVSDAASTIKVGEEEVSSTIRAKIASHPLYPKLLHAFIDCQKVGAPPEIASVLDEIQADQVDPSRASSTLATPCLGLDPELDCFMETYCEILVKYKSDLSRPFDEATSFLNDIEAQFHSLCTGASTLVSDDQAGGSSDEGVSVGDAEVSEPHYPADEDRALRDKLLRKYSGYISTLKHEFSKKKKKGKLPKEARQILLNWWNIHNKWPYPTETDKVALADLTGLDQKQINNWFINQRKRHWKPAENMQFGVLDGQYGPFFVNE